MLYLLRLKTILQYNWIYVLLLLIAIFFSYCFLNRGYSSLYHENEVLFTGTVLSTKLDGDKFTFLLKGKEKLICTYYLDKEEKVRYYDSFALGQKVQVTGKLSRPLHNTIPNTFDYHDYLKYQGIHYLVSVEKIEIMDTKISIFYMIKNALINYLKQFKSVSYLQMFILGNKNFLEEETYEQYQNLGISHIFAISGMHISLLIALLFKLLKKLREGMRYFIVIIFLLFYVFLTNYTASVLRSVTFFIFLYLNKKWSWNLKTISCYLLTISFLLFIKPAFLYDIGFRYSSLVSFSLVCYSSLLKGNYVVVLLKVSLLAFLFSLPITVTQNFEINVLSIFYNLLFVPLISFIVYPLNLLVFIVRPLDPLLYLLLQFIEKLAKCLPICSLIIPKFSWISIIFYYTNLFFFLKSYQKKYILFLIMFISVLKVIPMLNCSYLITFLDVGQGDCAIINYKGETVMIDTGGKVSFKEESWKKKKQYAMGKSILTYLKSKGITHLDYLILTHGDQDHLGEAEYLLKHFQVKNVILNKGEWNAAEKRIAKKAKIVTSYRGKIPLTFLDTGILYDNENDNSLLIHLRSDAYQFLFMGDASCKVEEDLIQKVNLKIDVLKLGHHGSKTSTGEVLLKSIEPKLAIISSGRNNRFKHPHQETLDILKKASVPYLNTQEMGSIEFIIKGTHLKKRFCIP